MLCEWVRVFSGLLLIGWVGLVGVGVVGVMVGVGILGRLFMVIMWCVLM